ncbi:MAG TPA: tetratricopeptide repeat protein [Verrucomicrobiae bacterium]|nr:tetratricopeptide repeat protein [Verrucomicrobiae bacterium]
MKGRKLLPLLVIAAGLLAYHNSFTGQFMLDDVTSISDNPTIRHLWPIWQCLVPPHRGGLTVESRPIINLSLAINYALGGLHVWGYHALNLTVHILAGLTLLGIVRRTLLQPPLRNRFGVAADELAVAVAVLWTVHPLQTESVTYVIQRAESIMGLFYLLTLYCFIRGAESPPMGNGKWFMGDGSWKQRHRLWYGLSVAACASGMASKEVMVSAPVMVLLYDRAFVSGSFRKARRQRWPLYAALASTWILLGLVLTCGQVSNTFMNAQRIGRTWWEYLATQPGVILYYLRLSVWPAPLCLYHLWPMTETWMGIVPPAIVVSILLGASVWAWRKSPVWGFVGAWFFLILAPSSSFIPLQDALYEYRMYLPLAAVVSVVVMGLYSVVGRQSLAVFAVMGIGLGFLTWRHNWNYQNEIAMRIHAVAEFPNDPASHYYLGVALGKVGRIQEEIAQYEQALRIDADYAPAHYGLGNISFRTGNVQQAIRHYEQALRVNPNFAEAQYNWGVALAQQGRVKEAVWHWEEALRIKPDYAEAHYNLGKALREMGKVDGAIEQYEQTLRIRPEYADAHFNLGNSLLQSGRINDAIGQYEQALRINPDMVETHYNLGIALEQAGRLPEAIGHYEQALRLKPDFTEARVALTRLQAAVGTR